MKTGKGVYAVFAAGFDKTGGLVSFSFQAPFTDQETAEAVGVSRWRSEYPDGKQFPVCVAYGPYALASGADCD